MNVWLRSTGCWLLLGLAAQAAELPDLINATFDAHDTLAPLEEPPGDCRACLEGLVWRPHDFQVRCEKDLENRCDLLIRFPSPKPSGEATNDLVAMEWYVARDASNQPLTAPAVVCVHESGSAMTVGRMFARGLRHLGLHTFMIHLPYYGARRGSPKPRAVDRLVDGTRQAIADVRRARDAVAALPLVDTEHIALQGTSLGGFVSATAAGLDDGYDGVFLVLAGGDLYDVLQNGKKDAAEARKELATEGLSGDQLKSALQAIEPLRVAHRLTPARTWLYSGTADTVVPLKNANALAAAAKLDRRHHVLLPTNHYNGILLLPVIISHISRRVAPVKVIPAEGD